MKKPKAFRIKPRVLDKEPDYKLRLCPDCNTMKWCAGRKIRCAKCLEAKS